MRCTLQQSLKAVVPGKSQQSMTFPHWAYSYMQSLLCQGSGLLLWSDVPGSLPADHLSPAGGGGAQWGQGGHSCTGTEIDRLLVVVVVLSGAREATVVLAEN